MKPLSLSRPHLIVMIGIPGSGKSTFAERFSQTFNAPLVSQTHFERLIFGSKYGKPAEEEKALEVTQTVLEAMLRTGLTIIYEDSTGSRHRRQELAHLANKSGYKPLFVWVQTDSVEANRRALRRAADAVPISAAQFEQAVQRFNVPVASEKAVVISGKHTYASQLKNVLKNLSSDRVAPRLQVPRRSIGD